MTYNIIYSNKFKKSLKKCFKRGLDIEKLRDVLKILERGEILPPCIGHINFPVIIKGIGSVIFSRIGYLYGNRMTHNSFCF